MSKVRIYFMVVGFMLLLFTVFAAVWFYAYHRYFVLMYHEQMQLFQFNEWYFRLYMVQIGGLTKYIGAFFTQFYFYPLAGSILIAIVLASVFLLFYSICKTNGNISRLFFIPFIPAILLMMAFVNIYFDMSLALGLLFALAGFRLYVLLRLPSVKLITGIILLTILYWLAAGNALLLALLMIIDELFEKRNRLKYLYLALMVAVLLIIPWLATRMFFTVPVREAYFALTPTYDPLPIPVNIILWLCIPVLYFLWRLMAPRIDRWKFVAWKMLTPNCLLMIVATGLGAHIAYDGRAEILYRMIFDAQNNQWEAVVESGKSYPAKNRLACYYTNLALFKTGQMPYCMFQYRQTGIIGLFLDHELTSSSMWYFSEVYYHLGMMLEAEHCTYESMIGSPQEPSAQTLQRLTYTNISRRDSATADKYIRFFEHSLAYRSWAKQQRKHLELAMADSSFTIPGTPAPSRCSEDFINYQYPDRILLKLLQGNPKNRMAFEYLMACNMLEMDLEQVKWCMDTYFKNFDYPDIPVHYEEALMVYQHLKQSNNVSGYPISRATRERYNRYIQAYLASKDSKRNFEQLQKQFGDTYWFYLHFVNPVKLQKKDEKNRY